jgi:1,4-alpha-glucan branching enzyme
MHQRDCRPDGFQWIDCDDAEQSVVSYLRWGHSADECLVVVCNFTPVVRYNYRIGVPWHGHWAEVLNSDAQIYGGSGQGNMGGIKAAPVSCHGYTQCLNMTLPPLSMMVFKGRRV